MSETEKMARGSYAEKFVDRHCGPSHQEVKEMLSYLGYGSLDELMSAALPANILATKEQLPQSSKVALSEAEALMAIEQIANKNIVAKSFIGQGYYRTRTPSVIMRCMLESPSWYTAYTPYQPEISQGRLEMLLNFQTVISDLTGLDSANASLLDEATAAAEAVGMMFRQLKGKRLTCLIDSNLFVQTRAVIETRAQHMGVILEYVDVAALCADASQVADKLAKLADGKGLEAVFGAVLAYPGANGEISDFSKLLELLKEAKVGATATTDLLALCMLRSPKDLGFDIAVGSAQRFGMPMGAGGPHAGFMSFVDSYRRIAPGRIVGISKDRYNRPAMRLSLQTREQHIRRDKATSNICTAQALPAMISAAYAVYHGAHGLMQIAQNTHKCARLLAEQIMQHASDKCQVLNSVFFDTVQIGFADKEQADQLMAKLASEQINLNRYSDTSISISCDECTLPAELSEILSIIAQRQITISQSDIDATAIDQKLQRSANDYLRHEVFSKYHCEHEMLRYMRKLASRDISLDRAMIPLGSCTMKLNAATEMMPLSWPQLANIHPFAPSDQLVGYQQLTEELARMLADLSGFAQVSLQPNAGAQGEYAGLLAVKSYLTKIGQSQRNICLIPMSAHGTNPASAVMAGFEVVPLAVSEDGEVSMEDLDSKCEKYADNLAALMITYPSTYGTYGKDIKLICEKIHQAGGQVYMDGANFNALLGVSYPGQIGADVMHFNLHKTFCIPHGGGGPGMGPIGVAAHLAEHLPTHPLAGGSIEDRRTIAAAPWGSALILSITWMYIKMMGADGLARASKLAVCLANYVAKRLSEHYQIAYVGPNGLVAHECVVDAREFKKNANVSVEDIAKRLIDYGYHAPTVSFPLVGSVMIEPTESETKGSVDMFCDCLIQIRNEIKQIEDGKWSPEDNPLVNAPHSWLEMMSDKWPHPYGQQVAYAPLDILKQDKYWPPVARIDQVWGDKHLICSCVPMEEYQEKIA